MLRWLSINLRTFMLAFTLAIAIWVTAVTAANPDETQPFPRSIPIEFIGQDSSLIMAGTTPQAVQVTMRAPRSVWDKLTSGQATVRAIADLSGLAAGEHTVEIQVQVATRPVRVISVTPRSLRVSLEPLVTRSLPVELVLSGEPAAAFQVGEAILTPAEAVVSGPESVVATVSRLQAFIDLSGARQGIEESVAIQAVGEDGAALAGVTIHPDVTLVSLPLVQKSGYRDLAVKVVTVSRPASGYRPTNVAAFPAIVTVYSDNLALVDSLPGYVETYPLDLSGARDDIEAQLNLNLPSGVFIIGEQTVLVQVGIAPIEGSLTFSFRPVEIIGLGDGLRVQLSPPTVDVILSGPIPVLDSLNPSDVNIRLDLTGLGAGAHRLTPTVVVNKQGVIVESILPGTVEVVITDQATPTP